MIQQPADGCSADSPREAASRPTGSGWFHLPAPGIPAWLSIAFALVLLSSAFPFLVKSSYRGSPDLHAAMELAGAVVGLVTGVVLVSCFCSLGNRLHLFIGLAFFVSGAEDLAHGVISFRNLFGMPEELLFRTYPATYAAGRAMLALLLIAAPPLARWMGPSVRPRREMLWASFVAISTTLGMTAAAFRAPLPPLLFPDWRITRPADFVGAILLAVALVVFLRQYTRDRSVLTWWIALAICFLLVGQLMMSFSGALHDTPVFDAFFDVALAYKFLGYVVPLLGFSIDQTAAIRDRRIALAALQRSESRLRQIMDLVPHLIFAKNGEGRWGAWSRTSTRPTRNSATSWPTTAR
jgi:PAS domain-containing protein